MNVRVTANRRTCQLSTKVYVHPRDWNDKKQQVRASHDLADAFNGKIGTVLNEARVAALDATSAKDVILSVKRGSGALLADLDLFVVELTQRGQESERQKYGVLRGKLVDCFGGGLTWEQLDRKALIQFEQYMRETRKNKASTIGNEMKRLRRLFRRALIDRSVRADQDPFLGYKPPKSPEPDVRKLTKTEFAALEQLHIDWGSALRVTRDAFLFAAYCGGVRIADLIELTTANIVDGRLKYQMSKTQRRVSMKLPDPAARLVESYSGRTDPFLFPIFGKADIGLDRSATLRRAKSKTVSVNRHLKKIAAKAGIERPEEVSSHVARHTFAERARKLGVAPHETGMTMRHSSTKETIGYQKEYDPDTVDAVLQAVWGTQG